MEKILILLLLLLTQLLGQNNQINLNELLNINQLNLNEILGNLNNLSNLNQRQGNLNQYQANIQNRTNIENRIITPENNIEENNLPQMQICSGRLNEVSRINFDPDRNREKHVIDVLYAIPQENFIYLLFSDYKYGKGI